MLKILIALLDLLTPRFIVERIAFVENSRGELIQLCREVDLLPGVKCDEVLEVRSFTFLGFCIFPKVVEKEEK